MKTITKEYQVYSFKELDPEIQEKVINNFREVEYQDAWLLDLFNEDATEFLKVSGWNDIKLKYSLSNCQGDGLSFSGKLNLDYFLNNVYSKKLSQYKKNTIKEYIYLIFSKGNTGHYCYAHKNNIEFDYNYQDNIERKYIDKLWQDILEEIKKYYIKLCTKLEKQGYDEIDYQLSKECIIEDIKASEYQFLSNGNIFNE